MRPVRSPPSKGGTVLHQVGDRSQEGLGELVDPRGGEMAGVDEEGGVGEPLVDEHAVDPMARGELHQESVVAGQDGRVARPGAERKVPGPEDDAGLEVLPELLGGALGVGGREGRGEVGGTPLATAPVHLLEAPEGSPDVGLQNEGVEAEQPLEEQAVVEAPAPRVEGSVTGEVEPRDVVDGLVLNDHVRIERQELVQPPQPILAVDAAHPEVQDLEGQARPAAAQLRLEQRGVGLVVGAPGHGGGAADAEDPYRPRGLLRRELPGAIAEAVDLDDEPLAPRLELHPRPGLVLAPGLVPEAPVAGVHLRVVGEEHVAGPEAGRGLPGPLPPDPQPELAREGEDREAGHAEPESGKGSSHRGP